MERDMYAKLVDKLKNGKILDNRFDLSEVPFSGIKFGITNDGRITMRFVYDENPETDYINQIVIAPTYIRVDTVVNGEVVGKSVSLT